MNRPIESDYVSQIAYARALEDYCNILEKKHLAQVSPLEFGNITFEKEDLIGEPLIWAQWPNKRKA
jgi:hypothetical protein